MSVKLFKRARPALRHVVAHGPKSFALSSVGFNGHAGLNGCRVLRRLHLERNSRTQFFRRDNFATNKFALHFLPSAECKQ